MVVVPNLSLEYREAIFIGLPNFGWGRQIVKEGILSHRCTQRWETWVFDVLMV
jgi:hypothetical protein